VFTSWFTVAASTCCGGGAELLSLAVVVL